MTTLKDEFEYYLANHKQIAKTLQGRVVVIKDKKIIGNFDNETQAIDETQKNHKLGTFLIQRVEADPDSYKQVFHSRIAFG